MTSLASAPRPRFAFGTASDVAEQLGIDANLRDRIARAVQAARDRGDVMPTRTPLSKRTLVHGGERFKVVVTRGELPRWLLDLDDDLQPVTFAAATAGRTGAVVLGVGQTVCEAIDNLRAALDRDARLVPRGQG